MAFLRRGIFDKSISSIVEPIRILRNERRCVSYTSKLGRRRDEISLNVIGAGPPVELSSILVSTPNNQAYLFNCGEDCVRFLIDDKHKLGNITDVFFTQVKWSCIGGISQLNSRIHDIKKRLLQHHGPQKLFKCIQRILCLSIMKNIDFNADLCKPRPHFENDSLRVDFISLLPKLPESTHLRNINEVIVYLCTLKQSVKPNQSRTHFLVLDLPSVEYVRLLAKNEQFKAYINSTGAAGLEIVADFTPEHVFNAPEYQELMLSFNSKIHMYLSRNQKSSYLKAAYELQASLQRIDDKIHPQLKLGTSVLFETNNSEEREKPTVYISETGVITTVKQRMPDEDEEIPCISRLKTYPKIVFLGTGATRQTAIRNVTSILVHAGYDKCFLLDCGEGTSAQIHRFYGRTASRIFANLRAVFVSHMHYDHYGGLIDIILARRRYLPAGRKPLYLLCPKNDLKSWLFFYDNTVEPIHDDLFFIDNNNLRTGLEVQNCRHIGVESFHTCHVPHITESYAASMEIKSAHKSFKLTFSGDTMLSDDLVELGRNSNLLIHEATFANEYADIASSTRHSTVAQAIENSQKMNASYTVLTHLHQRFNSFPHIDTERYPNIGIAFDNMELIESDLPNISTLYQQYRSLGIGKNIRSNQSHPAFVDSI